MSRRTSRPAQPVDQPVRSRRARSEPSRSRAGLRALVRALVFFVGCVLVTDAIFGERGLLEMRRARQRHGAVDASIGALRAENARLREEARRLREDGATIEAIARRDLGLIRRGEILFIVKDVAPLSSRHR